MLGDSIVLPLNNSKKKKRKTWYKYIIILKPIIDVIDIRSSIWYYNGIQNCKISQILYKRNYSFYLA